MTDEPEEDNSAQISEWLVGQLLEKVVLEDDQSPVGTEGWPEPENDPEPEENIEIQHDRLTTEANFDNNDGKSERESPINIYSLSNAADLMVDSVLNHVAQNLNNNRAISPFPNVTVDDTGSSRPTTGKRTPVLKQESTSSDELSYHSQENGEDINVSDSVDLQETDATEVDTSDSEMLPQVSGAKNSTRRRQSTVISLDRIEENLENDDGIEDVQSDSTESDDDEDDSDTSLNAAKSLHRPRSASLAKLRDESMAKIDPVRRAPLGEKAPEPLSDRDLVQQLGPGRNLNIWIGTWNLGLSTDVDLVQLQNFLNVQSSTRKDVYIFGCQEINSESVYTWEVQLQKCVGKKYILLHAVRFGTIHLSIFVRHELQGKCSTIDWGVLSVRAMSQIKTKGVAACALQIFGTKFLFMNSHFKAGETQNSLEGRVRNYRTIRSKLRLRRSRTQLKGPNNALTIVQEKYDINFDDYDCIFWFGDLNFRRNPESGEDELRACIKRSLCFEDFLEQPIQFDPTYKFQPNTQIYDLSRTLRSPSHTDRILYLNRVPITPAYYNSYPELNHSDHRPVAAIFQVQVSPVTPQNAPLSVNNGEFVVSVFKAAFYTPLQSISKSSTTSGTASRLGGTSKVCTIL
ncbi:unnamed protein product [Oikopleura dioica]|uniref:Inositol polyphosphate-related phosphatase domain-containing protein n=1 Tax=Oikopleura dioica TaxID=34765 RepID=E4Y0W2_OIKDI|nr:unnamed protein product [Oikopleura dioica]